MKNIKFAFHVHTKYSRDSLSEPERIIDYCRSKEIKAIAITDHSEIEGALQTKKIAKGDPYVIVGEEIKTEDGDLTALFIKEKIEPGQSIEETIREIKKQGGLVCLPHPGESFRREAISKIKSEAIIGEVDIIEIFNARTLLDQDNIWAKKLAEKSKKHVIVGSDGHFISEIGHALNFLNPFTSKESFLRSIEQNDSRLAVCHKTGLLVQLFSKAVVVYKKFKRW